MCLVRKKLSIINLPKIAPSLLLLVFLLGPPLGNFNTVQAIKCYVCQSNVDPKCADPFDNLTLPITDCEAYPRADLTPKTESDLLEEKSYLPFFEPTPAKALRASMCRKIRQKVNGEWRTIRGCGYLPASMANQNPGESPDAPELHCQVRHGTYDIFMEICACNNKDGCNGSAGLMSVESLTGLKLTIWLLLTLISILVSLRLSFDNNGAI